MEENHERQEQHITQLFWDDLPEGVVLISSSGASVGHASIRVGGVEQALLFRKPIGGLADIDFAGGEPTDAVLLATGRTIFSHQQAVRYGRAIA